MTITRFAPSPTGSLHIGGARTALFNYIFAKSQNGSFKIRIEDTDKIRNKNESVESILNGLEWLGIKTNEKIIYQSKNLKNHIDFANILINKNLAYKCYHDEKQRKIIKSKKKKFVSEWRDNKKSLSNSPYTVRIKIPLNNSLITINDKVQGKVTVKNSEIDDYVILRSNGTPTFLLSSALDDYEMKITDIIRGDDHLTNSFRQKIIFDFLKFKPNFAHIPLIHNEKNEKLSKRDNSLSITDYKENGFLPESIINYLLRLGWSHKNEEFFDISKAIKFFKLENLGKSPAKIDNKKLEFYNNYYIKKLENIKLFNILNSSSQKRFKKNFLNFEKETLKMIEIYKSRINHLNELLDEIFFIINPKKKLTIEEKKILEISKKYKDTIINKFSKITKWKSEMLDNSIKDLVKKFSINFKEIAQPIRISIVGKPHSPSISNIMEVLGKEEVLRRLKETW